MPIKSAMHPITKISHDTSITDAAKIMDNKLIGSVLVEQDGIVIGMLTERDILRKIVAKGIHGDKCKVGSIMTEPLISMSIKGSLEEAADLMKDNNVRRVLVKDKNEFVGIVTLRNVAERLRYSMAKKWLNHRKPRFSQRYEVR